MMGLDWETVIVVVVTTILTRLALDFARHLWRRKRQD